MAAKLAGVIICFLLHANVFGQNYEGTARTPKVLDRWDDKIILELTHDTWLNAPDGVEFVVPSIGFKGYFFTDYTFGDESNFSFV